MSQCKIAWYFRDQMLFKYAIFLEVKIYGQRKANSD